MSFDVTSAAHIILTKIENWLHGAVDMLPNLIIAVIFFLLFWFLGKLLRRAVDSVLSQMTHNAAMSRLVAGGFQFAIVTIGLFVSLGVLQLDKTVTSLLAGAGVIGLALGFAFQEIASNFLAGILLAFLRPFRVDDVIETQGFRGKVAALDLRSTRVVTFDGLEVILPNKDMFTKPITNYTSTPLRRIELKIGVSYSEDLRAVEKIVRTAVAPVPARIGERDIEFFYTDFGDSAINFVVRVWIDDSNRTSFARATHEAVILIKEAFDREKISIPFPIRTLEISHATDAKRSLCTAGDPSGSRQES